MTNIHKRLHPLCTTQQNTNLLLTKQNHIPIINSPFFLLQGFCASLGFTPPRGSTTGARAAGDPGGTDSWANQPVWGKLPQAASCWKDSLLVELADLASKGRW